VLDFPPPGEKSGFPYQCFFKFRVPSQERLHLLSHIFEILKQEKQKILESYENRPDEEIDEESDRQIEEDRQKWNEITENLFVLFDDQALAHFWWPTKQEREEHYKLW
jgi:regulator of sigma D